MTSTAPPSTGPLDIARLGGAMLAELRHGRDASMRRAMGRWLQRTTAARGSPDIILKLGPWQLLLVGSADLSRCILHAVPGDGVGAGGIKRKAMSFLAPRALTISDGDAWRRLRGFNEAVLEPGRLHPHAQAFVEDTREAFRAPVHDMATLRSAMRHAMLAIVFGPGAAAPEQLGTDVEALFGMVQSPVRRALLGRFAGGRRARVRETLRRLWNESPRAPGLLADARAAVMQARGAAPSEEEVLDQVPHWMFTFSGSATDLVARTLALVLSHPEAHRRLAKELAGASDDAGTIDGLPWLEACLLETAQLYPPVTRTFHRTSSALEMAGVALPPGLEMLHVFPPLMDDADGAGPRFRPERWLAASSSANGSFDPFMSGPRRCPGRSLILLICKVAVAESIRQEIALVSPTLHPEALPPALPLRGLRFRLV